MADEMMVECSLDLRYQGQGYYLNIPWQDMDSCERDYHLMHEQRYGHRLNQPVELVNVRVNVMGKPPCFQLSRYAVSNQSSGLQGRTRIYGVDAEVAVWQRRDLVEGQVLQGPVLVTETVSTTYVAPGWSCRIDRYGNLLLEFAQGGSD